jgi:heme-degrading monooxygenase HmoA
MNDDSTSIRFPDPSDPMTASERYEFPLAGEPDQTAQWQRSAANARRLLHEPVYTHVTWHVKPGQAEEFLAAWNTLGDLFSTLPNPPIEVTLIRRADDPTIFHSIGSWRSLADAQEVTESPAAIDAVARISELCSEGAPAVYEVVRQVRPQ